MASTFAEFFGGVTIESLPSQSDVRDGVTYGDGREGTLIVTGGSGSGAGLSGNQGAALDRLFAMTTPGNQFTVSALGNVPTASENALALLSVTEQVASDTGDSESSTVGSIITSLASQQSVDDVRSELDDLDVNIENVTVNLSAIDAIANAVAVRLEGRELNFRTDFEPRTQSIRIVQRNDYVTGSARGPLRIPLAGLEDRVSAGDSLRLGLRVRPEQQSTTFIGSVLDQAGELFGVFEIAADDLGLQAGQTKSRYELDHVSQAGGYITTLIEDSPLVVVQSHAEA